VLLQEEEDSVLRLVAFMLQKLNLVETNYKIYNKELLAIVCAFKE
jgi:hypothetical protein